LIARQAYHVGPSGSGLRMKLVSNLVLGLNRAALAESLILARNLGLDLRAVLSVLRDSPAASRVMETKGEKMIQGDYSPQARLSQHHKDVRIMLGLAENAGFRLPLSETHERILQAAEDAGLGGLDNSAIFAAYERLTRAAGLLQGEAAGDPGGETSRVSATDSETASPDPPPS
ncbi:MAG: NAD(P)-dependent oxidoreductase, partial [Isosphaeraceae bacterium]